MANKKNVKKGVIMNYDILEQLEDFNDKDFRDIVVAIINYDKDGTLPDFNGEKKGAFKCIKTFVDKNNDEYKLKCETNRRIANDRWEKERCANAYERIQTDTNDTLCTDIDIDKDIDKDYIIKKENIIKEKVKHKLGKFGRIKLDDNELTNLNAEFGENYISAVIDVIDEYVESNNNKNKYSNFNLVIRKAIREKWSILKNIQVIDNVEEKKNVIDGVVYE